MRVVSLVPSTTESLFALGVPPVGVTRFCVHPAAARALPKVGGTKDVDLERLAALQPELVVGNVEENDREQFEAITAPKVAFFPRSVDEALDDLLTLGRLVGRDAGPAVEAIRARRAALKPRPFRYAYLIWRKPWMAAGCDTFVSAMLAEVGGINALEGRYPTLEPTDLRALDLDRVLLSSEPFPFAERHLRELAEESGLPEERFMLIDGEACSWHGVRMGPALDYLGECFCSS